KDMSTKPEQSFFDRFLHSQTVGSVILIFATATALMWANSDWAELYYAISHLEIGVHLAGKTYQMHLEHWVKDGLMAIFFFVVGLEVKREVVVGELSSVRQAVLPVMAAVGGCTIPALLYFLFNRTGDAASGWGVPMATDIAFALGILALFGRRVPIGLKIFLTALAIVDDLIAVIVIAVFYTEQINIGSMIWAAGFLALFFTAVKFQTRRPALYLVPAIGVWVCVMLSGIHATIAGVIIALLIPVKSTIEPKHFFDTICMHMQGLKTADPLTRESLVSNNRQRKSVEQIYLTAEDMIPTGIALEKHFHPVQAFIILPLFALFSAGVTFNTATMASFPGPVSLGIICGLVFGKQIGILFFSWIAVESGQTEMPEEVRWPHIWGVSLLAGIGFTMSIFISELGFSSQAMIDEAKIGIFTASLLAGIGGYLVLNRTLPSPGTA
ncbi:MAG TPA: Na+/H+ antiporter NhaA, partial [Thermodesulfobacteriaceae bacterium]|nr:Na+/H+ antiporter NhaA [Thermodesulfobacteriaceae bacterium]